MTKEINDIIKAFEQASVQGRRTALATVVHVEGSSYRRAGARMLVEDNGRMTGAISGGCLEGDALRKALMAINRNENKLVTYDTLHEDDIEFGVQLGCNGIVHILFEPIDPNLPHNPIELLRHAVSKRRDAILVTLFSMKNYKGFQPGTSFFFDDDKTISGIIDKKLENEIATDSTIVLRNKRSEIKEYVDEELTAFIEIVQPPVSLVIVGAGNDALPMVEMASLLGWQVTVVDGRISHATKRRFPKAYKVIVGKPAEVLKQIEIDQGTAFVLMTHNYNYDLVMLELLLKEELNYIGTLGPKQRLERMLSELQAREIEISEAQLSGMFGPTGLDIGAEAAEEIALSVLSEISAVFGNRRGGFLRERPDTIHQRIRATVSAINYQTR